MFAGGSPPSNIGRGITVRTSPMFAGGSPPPNIDPWMAVTNRPTFAGGRPPLNIDRWITVTGRSSLQGGARPLNIAASKGLTMPRISQTEKRYAIRRALAGIDAQLDASTTPMLHGKRHTVAEMKAVLQRALDAAAAVDKARAAYAHAVRQERAASRPAEALLLVLKGWIVNHRGPKADVLGAFGWKPPKKPGPKTVEGKARGAAKTRATRAAKKAALQEAKRARR
jgi:hypothetical protein